MKISEIKEMTDAELETKLKELKSELLNLRFSHATGQLTNPKQMNVAKKDIARIKTIQTIRRNGNKV
ncbi:MAG: 50S ribosomal protein L29 [Clostridia bacterium]|nr:50S ribosomal protein L29 [Clostridia bacterium]